MGRPQIALAAAVVVAALLASLRAAPRSFAGGDKPKPPAGGKPAAPPAMAEPAAPAADPSAKPAGKNWSAHTGNLKFVVGFDEGMEEAYATGRPAMLFFTSSTDKWCPIFGKRTWTNQSILAKVKAYLPVLVDVDTDKGKEIVKRYTVLVLPSVIWVDPEGNDLFTAQGDIPIEIFETLADTAKDRAPDPKPPTEELQFAERVRADYRKASDAGNVRKMLDAAAALSAIKRPKGVAEEGQKLLADLDAKGKARLDAAKKALADGKPEAKAELEKLAVEYRGRPVGLEAASALPKSADGEK